MEPIYTASAVAIGDGRNGHVRTMDGLVDTDVRTPKEMGGAGGAPNPELLFAAGYAACFHNALRRVVREAGADATDSEVVADVFLSRLPNRNLSLAVQLEISLPNVDPDAAREFMHQAHQICPYSNATRGNIEVTLTLA